MNSLENKCLVIGEIGINHNGDVDIAKKLIDVASFAGCDYVKFQKRTPHLCVPDSQKDKIRETPWGKITYLEYKQRIEFGKFEYDEIDSYCKSKKIKWFASAWDIPSVEFLTNYTDVVKIASASITDLELVKDARNKNKTLMISSGMSTEVEIEKAVEAGSPDVIFHTNSTYPSPEEDLNLGYIKWLKEKYPQKTIGYSGHEFGLTTTWAAIAMGASIIERHITLDRTMWGSDQMASVEPHGLIKLIKGIRCTEKAIAKGYGPREVFSSELSKKESLRQ